MKIKLLYLVVVLVAVGLIVWALQSAPKISEDDVVSRTGIHWHPRMEIIIKGVRQTIPEGVGTPTGAHVSNIHTHDDSGTLHMEHQGLVTRDRLRMKNFFNEWGKRFDRECIMDSCNGPDGQVKMTVNGAPNDQFENYEMRDNDKIIIKFE